MRASLTREQSELLDQTLNLARAYLRLEAEICEALRGIDRTKLYKKLGHRSLFQYVTDRLGFSGSVAYAFVSVTRKSAVIPALQIAIEKKHLTVAKASRIVSSMTPENAAALIEFAGTHSCRETEREIARLNPKVARPDRVKALAENLNEIQGTISDQVNEKLKRAESLMAQKGQATDLNSVLEAALDEYLKHHDPVKKALRGLARRAKSKEKSKVVPQANTKLLRTRKNQLLGQSSGDIRKAVHTNATSIRESESSPTPGSPTAQVHSVVNESKSSSLTIQKRVPLTAEQKHVVFHRDQGRCMHIDETGKRCGSDRWIDVHHIIEVSRGGTNEPSNLTLLCGFHHDLIHQLSLPLEGQFNWIREPRALYS